ncbi:hypothetical protein BH23BAC1_BH23BAC1_27150 [soil metagenome]
MAFKKGITLFLLGFIGSESIVFLQPLFIITGLGILPLGNDFIFLFSLLMVIGLSIICFNMYQRSHGEKVNDRMKNFKSKELKFSD